MGEAVKHTTKMFVMVIIFSVVSVGAHPQPERHRRAVFPEFPTMIWQVVGRNPLDYNEYGNYCGFGGNGEEPVDDTDRCCMLHDKCYSEAQNKHCGTILAKPAPYFLPYGYGLDFEYKYTIEQSKIKCEMGSTLSSQVVRLISTTMAECGHNVCQCDADAVLCFNQSIYNPEYKRGVVPTVIKYTGVAISAPFHIAAAVAEKKIGIAKSFLGRSINTANNVLSISSSKNLLFPGNK